MSKLSTDTTDRTSKQALVGSSVLLLDLIAVTRACRVAVTKVAACYADAAPPSSHFFSGGLAKQKRAGVVCTPVSDSIGHSLRGWICHPLHL
jgi:hypothetical protein